MDKPIATVTMEKKKSLKSEMNLETYYITDTIEIKKIIKVI